MTLRRLIASLTIAVLAIGADTALAQSAFPAPLPGQAGQASVPTVPPVSNVPNASLDMFCRTFQCALARTGGFSGAQAEQCTKEFTSLREDAEHRGELINKEASVRHAAPDEACKLVKNFVEAEVRMISYVESHGTRCGIPEPVSEQLRNGHKNTEALQTRVCAIAQQMQQRGSTGGYHDRRVLPIGDFPPYYGR